MINKIIPVGVLASAAVAVVAISSAVVLINPNTARAESTGSAVVDSRVVILKNAEAFYLEKANTGFGDYAADFYQTKIATPLSSGALPTVYSANQTEAELVMMYIDYIHQVYAKTLIESVDLDSVQYTDESIANFLEVASRLEASNKEVNNKLNSDAIANFHSPSSISKESAILAENYLDEVMRAIEGLTPVPVVEEPVTPIEPENPPAAEEPIVVPTPEIPVEDADNQAVEQMENTEASEPVTTEVITTDTSNELQAPNTGADNSVNPAIFAYGSVAVFLISLAVIRRKI